MRKPWSFLSGLLLLAATAAQAQFMYETNHGAIILTNYQGPGGAVTISNFVTSIGNGAFYACTGLTSVTFPRRVTTIGESAFQYCVSLTSIIIPGSVTHIGDYAFANCVAMTNAVISNGVTSIGSSAFFDCTNMTHVVLGNSVISIGESAFEDCSGLTSVTIPESVTNLGEAAFVGCHSLARITIPNGVTGIGDMTFDGCYSLTSVTIPKSVTNIGELAFWGCIGLTNITIPNGVTSIGNAAFEDCPGLANVMIGSNVTSIGEYAFYLCSSLTTLAIPASVTNIGRFAFQYATGLTAAYFRSNAPSGDSTVFTNDSHVTVYYLPGTSGWSSTFGGAPAVMLNPPVQAGDLEVAISPAWAVTNGAQWQADKGVAQPSGATVLGLAAGPHPLSFTAIPGWETPPNQKVTITNGATTRTTGLYTPKVKGSPKVAITSPKSGQSVSNAALLVKGAVADEVAVYDVYYQLNGGPWTLAMPGKSWNNWTAGVTLLPGVNTFSAYAEDISASTSLTNTAVFNYIPCASLAVRVNGNGTFTPKDNGALMAIGTNYTLRAVAGRNWIFSNWVASGSENFVSYSPALTFTMQSDLTLTANFITNNLFLAAQGKYYGLFQPGNARQNTNSGAINFTLTSSGSVSGCVVLDTETNRFSTNFNVSGIAQFLWMRKGKNTLTTTLFIEPGVSEQSFAGEVTDGSFVASIWGFRSPFSSAHPATNYEGHYTAVIPGGNTNAALGPWGYGYGTVTVDALGNIAFIGSLADGTPVSRSSTVCTDGYWPLYLPLYGGNGSFWALNQLTNESVVSHGASWINATNSASNAANRGGFTNQDAPIFGSWYDSTNKPLFGFTNGVVFLQGTAWPEPITNSVAISSNGTITPLDNTNHLKLAINASTGVITGTVANPADANKTITFDGVLLQRDTICFGYFLDTNQSGVFVLQPR